MPKFKTVRFGELEYDAKDEIILPEGLVGMANLKRWLILDMGDDLPMKYFQSLDRGDFGFPISQPGLFHDEYQFDVPESAQNVLGKRDREDLTTLVITTVHAGGTMVTGNLRAPLVINVKTRKGIQVTLDTDEFGLRQEINYFKFGLAVQGEASDNGVPESQEEVSPALVSGKAEDHDHAQAEAKSSEPIGV